VLLATGHTVHICVDLAGRMAKIPQPIMARLATGVEHMLQELGKRV
jgi:acyl-CoA thioesterase FadM